jgi:hypothetical protein
MTDFRSDEPVAVVAEAFSARVEEVAVGGNVAGVGAQVASGTQDKGSWQSPHHAEVPNMLEHALEYRRRGLSVFPVCSPEPEQPARCREHSDGCQQVGKRPLVPWRLFITQLPTEDEIRRYWTRWPHANIGMATGKVSDTDVLDTDSVEAALAAEERGIPPGTPIVKTGKGRHYWFAYPGFETRNFAGRFEGTDYRGDGGYVLLPPSLHKSGRRYQWERDSLEAYSGFPPMPNWLADALKARNETSNRVYSDGDVLNWAEYLDGIPEGQRDTRLYAAACKMRAEGWPREAADITIVAFAEKCDPPFSVEEALKKAERAYAEFPSWPVLLSRDWNQHECELVNYRAEQEWQRKLRLGEIRAVAIPGPKTEADEHGAIILDSGQQYWLVSLAELMAIPEEPDVWLVEGLIYGKRLHWFYADPGGGKSLMAIWIGLHVAAGEMMNGLEVQQGPVVFFSEDMTAFQTLEYVRKLARGGGFEDKDIPFYVNNTNGLHVTTPADVQRALTLIERVKPTLVIFDSCERFSPAETYSSKEFSVFQDLVFTVARMGSSVIVIDHTNKKDGESINRIIGARAKGASPDVAYSFTGHLKDGPVTMHPTKERNVNLIQRRLTMVGDPAEGWGRFEMEGIRREKLEGTAASVVKVLVERRDYRDNAVSRAWLAEKLKKSDQAIKRALTDVIGQGYVVRDEVTGQNGERGRQFVYRAAPLPDMSGLSMEVA